MSDHFIHARTHAHNSSRVTGQNLAHVSRDSGVRIYKSDPERATLQLRSDAVKSHTYVSLSMPVGDLRQLRDMIGVVIKELEAAPGAKPVEPMYLAFIRIGAGSSWSEDKDKATAVANARKQLKRDWGSMFELPKDPREINGVVYDIAGLDGWVCTVDEGMVGEIAGQTVRLTAIDKF